MGKRTKTFQDKQRPLTGAEAEALKHLKGSGKVLKNEVMTPEKLKLQDGDKEEKRSYYENGRLITPEVLEAERKHQEEEDKRFQVEFRKQLKEWIDVDHHSEYAGLEFDHDDYLVRVFNMDVSSFDKFITLEYEYSPALQDYKLKDAKRKENLFPIVKILKVGTALESGKYNVGDVVLVPSTDILGEDWNPKFLHIMQFQKSQGMKPILPEGMKQSIPNVEKNWERYAFVRPWVAKPEPIDELTYLIPSAKVRGSFTRHDV